MQQQVEMVEAKARKFDKEALIEKVVANDGVEDGAEMAEIDATRRMIRKKQSDLQDELVKNKDELLDIRSEAHDKIRNEMNECQASILYTREALGDVRVLSSLGKNLHTKAIRLDDNSKRLNFKDFVIRLKGLFKGHQHGGEEEYYGEPEEDDEEATRPSKRKRPRGGAIRNNDADSTPFDWCTLGADVGALFTTTFPATMMLGPLGKPPKVRVAAERAARPVKDNSEVAVAEELIQDEDDDEDSETGEKDKAEFNEATFARIDHQEKVLRELRDKGEDTGLISFLVDPHDQVQTVENFFDYAFLIKEQSTSQKIDKATGLPVIKPAHREMLAEKESKQLVLSMNMQELKELAAIMQEHEEAGINSNGGSGLINNSSSNGSRSNSPKKRKVLSLHRDDALYKTSDVHQQTALIQEIEAKSKERLAAKRKARLAAEKQKGAKLRKGAA